MTISEKLALFGRIKQMELRLQDIESFRYVTSEYAQTISSAIDILKECGDYIENSICKCSEGDTK